MPRAKFTRWNKKAAARLLILSPSREPETAKSPITSPSYSPTPSPYATPEPVEYPAVTPLLWWYSPSPSPSPPPSHSSEPEPESEPAPSHATGFPPLPNHSSEPEFSLPTSEVDTNSDEAGVDSGTETDDEGGEEPAVVSSARVETFEDEPESIALALFKQTEEPQQCDIVMSVAPAPSLFFMGYLEPAPLVPFIRITLPKFPSDSFSKLPIETCLLIAGMLRSESPKLAYLSLANLALVSRSWYEPATAQLHDHVRLGGWSKMGRDLVHTPFLEQQAASGAGGMGVRPTSTFSLVPRGPITSEEDVFKVVVRGDSVKVIEVDLRHIEKGSGWSREGVVNGGFSLGFMFRQHQAGFPNLVSLSIHPGPLATIIDMSFKLTGALPNLTHLLLGETSPTPTTGYPNLLYSIFSGIIPTCSFTLELVFSPSTRTRALFEQLLNLSPFFLPVLTTLKFSHSTPLKLLSNILPYAPRLGKVVADHDLPLATLHQIIMAPIPSLHTLGLTPVGYHENICPEETFLELWRARTGGQLAALTTLEFHSRSTEEGGLVRIDNSPQLIKLEALCVQEGIRFPERAPWAPPAELDPDELDYT
ncbi:hypothetical protein RQP46_004355 [Phenoliferia psychrophenolica]